MEYSDVVGTSALLTGNIHPHSREVFTFTVWHHCSKALPYCYCFICQKLSFHLTLNVLGQQYTITLRLLCTKTLSGCRWHQGQNIILWWDFKNIYDTNSSLGENYKRIHCLYSSHKLHRNLYLCNNSNPTKQIDRAPSAQPTVVTELL